MDQAFLARDHRMLRPIFKPCLESVYCPTQRAVARC
jgi:hypothetical protein